MYGSLKGNLSLTWETGVCFLENRSLFSKNWIGKSKFALKNGDLNKGVCFRKWEFENGSMFWKIEVCFRKSEFESGRLFSKIGVENQNLFSKIGVWRRRLSFGPRLYGGVHDEMEVNAEATTTRKQPFWTWPKTRSKISKKRSAKEERKEGKQNAEPPVHL